MKKTLILLIMLTGAILLHAQVRRTPVQQRKAVQTSSGMYKGTLGHYELRGPVKTCKEIGDDWELNYFFEINGVISTINGESVSTSPRTYEFDTNGRIIRFFPNPGHEHLYEKYDYDKVGRLTKTTTYDDNYAKDITTIFYNEKGYCFKKTYVAYGPHGGNGTSTCKVLETDQYGNWTKRTWGSIIERREITYYE